MSYTIVGYLVYIPLTFYITVFVGYTFYKHGQHYIDDLLPDNLPLAKAINRMLLIGYYLLNLGYLTMSLSIWQRLNGLVEVIEYLSIRVAIILTVLGLMHFFNMTVIWWYGRKHRQFIHSINP
jgi:hypothetical protein